MKNNDDSSNSATELEMYSSQDYFPTPARNGLIQQLSHLAFFGDGVSVVIGNDSSGKSSILNELKGSLQIAPFASYIALSKKSDIAGFINDVVSDFELPSQPMSHSETSLGECIAELRHFNQSLLLENKAAVLVVDNAQYLDEQALAVLLSLFQGATSSGSGIRVILFSEKGILEKIDALHLVDVSVYDFDIPNLSLSELEDFLEFYGKKENLELPENLNIQKIWSSTKGHVGNSISMAFGEIHEDAPFDELEEEKVSFLPVGHVVAVIILFGVLSWAFFIRNGDSEPVRIVSNLKPSEHESGVVSAIDRELIKPNDFKEIEDDPVEPEIYPSVGEDDGQAESVEGFEQIDEQDLNLLNSKEVNVPEAEKKLGAIDVDYQQVDEPEVIESNVVEEVLPAKVEELPVVAKNSLKVIEKNSETPKAASEEIIQNKGATVRIEPKTTIPIKKPQYTLSDDESFLMSLPPSNHVLQIVAASKKDALIEFVRKQSIKDRLYIYHGERQGKLWYIVVEGPYKDKSSALFGRANLPDALAKSGPWPRELVSIQAEIDSAKQFK